MGADGLLDSREYLETHRRLRQALGLAPWAFTPCDVEVDEPMPAYLEDRSLCSASTWDRAVELRRELIEVAAAST